MKEAVAVAVVVVVAAAAKVGRLKTKEAAIMMPKSIRENQWYKLIASNM